MKKFTLTFAMLCAACAITFAGPERMQSSGKEVVQTPVAETSCFAGWYFGIHGGALISNFNNEVVADEDSLGPDEGGPTPAVDRSSGNDGASAEGGLHAGYNWQRGQWVFGFEADLSAGALDQHNSATAVFDNRGASGGNDPDIYYSTKVSANSRVDWYSTERLRLGHTFGDRVFLYATGGLAFGGTELEERTAVYSFRFGEDERDVRAAFNQDRGINFGWTAGAGLDFCLSQHITLNFTYLYVDLEDSNASANAVFIGVHDFGGARAFNSRGNASSDNAFHVVQAGLSYHF